MVSKILIQANRLTHLDVLTALQSWTKNSKESDENMSSKKTYNRERCLPVTKRMSANA